MNSAIEQVTFIALNPVPTLAQFVIQQLLSGINVKLTIGGEYYEGYIHNLDFAKGADHVHASVYVPTFNKDGLDIRISIKTDGQITIMPAELQPED